MAEPETKPTSTTSNTNNGLDMDALIESIMGTTSMSAEAQIKAAEIAAETALTQQKRGQEYLREGTELGREYYAPYSQRGEKYQGLYDDLIKKGAPEYKWNKGFDYSIWKWDKEFDHQSMEDYMKGRMTQEGLKDSPYYGLYQYQQSEQDNAINKYLRARGLYNSGTGMKKALDASTGLSQKYTADEYERAKTDYGVGYDQALNKYMLDYEQALKGHSIGYEEEKQKYQMAYEQYLKKYGIDYGQYMDMLGQYSNQGNYGWMANQAIANLYKDQGSQLNQGALQTGQTVAALQSKLGSDLGSTYNAQANTMSNLYNSQANRNLTSSLANQAQQNYNNANSANQTLGYLNLGSQLARTGANAYNYFGNNNSNSNSLVGNLANYDYNTSLGTAYGYNGINADSALYW